MSVQRSARDVAEAKFAAKLMRHQEARRAMSEYEAESRRIAENTARLKALRLAKEAAEGKAEAKTTPEATKRTTRRKAAGR